MPSAAHPAPQHFFAPCPRGLEALLQAELTALGAQAVHTTEAGVAFCGDFTLGMRANLHSRLASRILWQVAHGTYQQAQDLYDAALACPWGDWFRPEHTLRVDTRAHRCPLKSLDFVTLRVKDAICDQFRAREGRRPSIDTRQPHMRVHVYLDASTYFLYLDTSGDALFKRGQRPESGDAALKKNLAAGVLRLAGWQPETPLVDPFCGSGAFLVEAAEQSLGRAPGLERSFAFEKINGWDPSVWNQLRAQARSLAQAPRPLPLWGRDLKGDAIDSTRANLAAAGLESCVQLKQVNMLESSAPTASGILVANPPYGVRMGEQEQLARFYPELGHVLKRQYAGWDAWILTADLRLAKLIRLNPARRIPLFNGALECRLFHFPLVAGSHRHPRAPTASPVM